ncbi:MAG: low affinity iron permease family protein [Terracidiphilus sp.]|jgi:low affinity Fe/Cu permease
MTPPAVDPQNPSVHVHFGRFASRASAWFGSTWAFVAAGIILLGWAASGPIFHFSPQWTGIIGTGTSLLTLFMVLLIQNTQNRDSRAINLKLNELIRAVDKAGNHMIDIERLTDLELDQMQATYEKVRTAWTERQARTQRIPPEK